MKLQVKLRSNSNHPLRSQPKIDLVLELIDARAPLATQIKSKYSIGLSNSVERWIVMCKTDLADPKVTFNWLRFFHQIKQPIYQTIYNQNQRKIWLQQVKTLMRFRQQKIIYALVTGIANVGKSTFINRLIGRSKVITGHEPGLTRGVCWLRVCSWFKIIDTPGQISPPPMHRPLTRNQLTLVWIKAWPYHQVQLDAACWAAIQFLWKHHFKLWKDYFRLPTSDQLQLWSKQELLLWAERLGLVNTNHNQKQIRFLNDLSRGRMGLISFERVNCG